MTKQEVATVKSEHVMKLMSKLWECVPDEKKQELVQNEDVTVKAIQILEKELGLDETIIPVLKAEEHEEPEEAEETEESEEEGESDDD